MLASNSRPGVNAMPREVTIPIGFKAEGFYFLHSAAIRAQGLIGLYQIQYADGKTFDIPLEGDVNIRDWITRRPDRCFARRARGRCVAWTGKCPMFPTISVYRMLWVNPRPEVAVKAIRFSNPTMDPVPILVAMTAALAKGQSTETPKNLADIRDLLNEAGKLIAEKNDPKAIEKVKAAVALDPTQTTSQQALADIYERQGDEANALATLPGLGSGRRRHAPALQPHRRNPRKTQGLQGRPGRLHQEPQGRVEPAAHHRGQEKNGRKVTDKSQSMKMTNV